MLVSPATAEVEEEEPEDDDDSEVIPDEVDEEEAELSSVVAVVPVSLVNSPPSSAMSKALLRLDESDATDVVLVLGDTIGTPALFFFFLSPGLIMVLDGGMDTNGVILLVYLSCCFL